MSKDPISGSLFGNGPPSAHAGSGPGTTFTNKYLGGLPDQFQPNYQPYITSQFPKGHQYMGAGGAQSVKPRYSAGSEWTQVLGLGTETLASIQQSMAQAGMLKPGSFHPGAPDAATKSAVTQLLTEANANGMTWLDYLAQRVSISDQIRAHGGNPGGAGSAGPTKAPLEIQLSNPDTIKAQVLNDSTNLIGTNAPQSPDSYVQNIQGAERLQQTEQYNQTGAGFAGGTGGTTTDAPSVDASIIAQNKPQYQAFQLGQHGQAILSALTGQTPGGGAFAA